MEDTGDNVTSNYSSIISTSSVLPLINITSSILSTTDLTTTEHSFYNETTAASAAAVETFTQSRVENVSQQAWKNLTRVGAESLPKAATSVAASSSTTAGSLCTTTVSTTTTKDPFDEFGPPEGVEYIFVPLGVMIFVIVLSAVVRNCL